MRGGGRNFSIPVTIPKAVLSVHTVIDSNNNGQFDDGDPAGPAVTLVLTDPNGLKRKIHAGPGGGYFNGVDYGKAGVWIDPTSLAENMEVLGGLKQSVDVTDYKEYTINFLFKPYRSLRGQVTIVSGARPPHGMVIKLGDVESPVDSSGYYWLKELPEGSFDLQVQQLPKGYCVLGGEGVVQVATPYHEIHDIRIDTKCQ